jgi:hypothetical protein
MAKGFRHVWSDRGFSASGLVCAVAVALTVTGTSLTGVTLARDMSRADADASNVARALIRAAAQARDDHHAAEVRVAQDHLRIARADLTSAAHPVFVVHLRDGFSFHPTDVPRAAHLGSRSFASVSTIGFDAEGRLVRQSADDADLAIYLGKPGAPLATRAIVIASDGKSFDIYRWNGSRWKR